MISLKIQISKYNLFKGLWIRITTLLVDQNKHWRDLLMIKKIKWKRKRTWKRKSGLVYGWQFSLYYKKRYGESHMPSDFQDILNVDNIKTLEKKL